MLKTGKWINSCWKTEKAKREQRSHTEIVTAGGLEAKRELWGLLKQRILVTPKALELIQSCKEKVSPAGSALSGAQRLNHTDPEPTLVEEHFPMELRPQNTGPLREPELRSLKRATADWFLAFGARWGMGGRQNWCEKE